MEARNDALSRLSELLGDEHNLSVYRQVLESEPEQGGKSARPGDMQAVVEQRRSGLRRRTRSLAMRLYTGKPGPITSRFAGYWQAWRAESD